MEGLDARDAEASVASDKDMILRDIETTVGMEEFNRRVRDCVLAEYKRVGRRQALGSPASTNSRSLVG